MLGFLGVRPFLFQNRPSNLIAIMADITIPLLCEKDDMERQLSLRGLISRSDHEEEGVENDDVINDAIQRASHEIAGFLYPKYDLESLPESDLVRGWATSIACFYLCQTRGNEIPESMYADYDRIMGDNGWLERTRNGKFILPCVRQQDTNVPTFSNHTIDRRFRREKVRVVPTTSSPIRSTIEQDRSPEIIIE